MLQSAYFDTASLDLLLHAARKLPWRENAELPRHAVDYLTQLHSALDPNSLQTFRLDDLAYLARDFWRWTDVRPKATSMVRTRRAVGNQDQPLDYTMLEICGDDMPFIIRSVTGACHDLNIHPVLLIHPILDVARDDTGQRLEGQSGIHESYVQLILDYLDDDLCKSLEAEIQKTLDDLQIAVTDYQPLQGRMVAASRHLASISQLKPDVRDEAVAFLDWLVDDNFTFLGSREYAYTKDNKGQITPELPDIITGSGLGILRDDDRYILADSSEPLTGAFGDNDPGTDPLIVSKGTMKSRVHRRVRVDYIGILRFDDEGNLIGETRFAGLFTADAYNRRASSVPLVRKKIEQVLGASGKRRGSHDYSALQHIVETYPRDEMFQISAQQLLEFSLAILQLENKNETRMFVRYDRYDRFVSVLVFLSKEVFESELRSRIGQKLCEAFDGRLTAFYSHFGDGHLARIHYLIDLPSNYKKPNPDKLEENIARLAESWNDKFRDIVRKERLTLDLDVPEEILTSAFNAAYKEAFTAEEALADITAIQGLIDSEDIKLKAYKLDPDAEDTIRAKIYSKGEPLELSSTVPVFENMGLFVSTETAYPIDLNGTEGLGWVHVLNMKSMNGRKIALSEVGSLFEDAFYEIWTGQSVSDGFNRLIFAAGFSWREVNLFRTLCRYRAQSGLDPEQVVQIEALTKYSEITNDLLGIFLTKFDPDLQLSIEVREQEIDELSEKIRVSLESVPSLEHDIVLRRLRDLILAIKRTNFYQLNDDNFPFSHIAIKIACRELKALPDPKPYREIFVWAPHVEGVHLRFGPVSRGGLRWSDRPNDFRTEVLGLVKAQQVKNAVIVPVGSKGGFFPKKLPGNGSREDVRNEAIRSYKTFITALLQVTDNIVEGEVVHPTRTLLWDDPDPYLVVAADKGTATFSDIANGISQSLGFWLGDAFASGGSVGYDHKKMGITARGAWVAVQRHFRELNIDVQTDPISVVGVGDMSGDVFGNGMLLSKALKLKAAFNHMHIFLDPDPKDAIACYEERKRLFDLPRSSWEDYNPNLISKGGGVFSRSLKSIALSPEIQTLLQTEATSLAPNDLIKAILAADVDLIWFGGIGTYFKATEETHGDAGDKVNNALRLNANEIRAKVIGEGANLGITQKGRIEFARNGGRLNTDAIDNSAGVDSSDHEVNIKILLATAIERGQLDQSDRTSLLASMTDTVAELVLRHNYDQTGALSDAQITARPDLDSHERFMTKLENEGILDRKIEDLPSSEAIRELAQKDLGLSRPELSVLLAYSKIVLFDNVVSSDVPDDPFLNDELLAYFPEKLHQYSDSMENHKLKREIIATRVANEIVNLGGITFIDRVQERTGASVAAIVKAFVASNDIFNIQNLLNRIDNLDYKLSSDIQSALRINVVNVLRRLVFWFVKTQPETMSISGLVTEYKDKIDLIRREKLSLLSHFEQDLMTKRAQKYVSKGTPDDLATDIVTLNALLSATDIVDVLSKRPESEILNGARLYHSVGAAFKLDQLKFRLSELSFDSHWDRLAAKGLAETFIGHQSNLTASFMSLIGSELTAETCTAEYIEQLAGDKYDKFVNYHNLLAEMEEGGSWSFAKLVLLSNELRLFADHG